MDKTLSWTSTFLEAANTNDYPIIIGADIIWGQHDILTSSKWIFDKLENDEVREIKVEEEIEDTNLATLICHSSQSIEPNAKCIVEYKLKIKKKHAIWSKKNPDSFKNTKFSAFIEHQPNTSDNNNKYSIEPTLDSITKYCGKFYTTGIIVNNSDNPITPKDIKIKCEIISNASEKTMTKSNLIKTFFHQSNNFTPEATKLLVKAITPKPKRPTPANIKARRKATEKWITTINQPLPHHPCPHSHQPTQQCHHLLANHTNDRDHTPGTSTTNTDKSK